MFEIEHNFKLEKAQEEQLLKEAEILGEKIFTDVYYDNDAYDLTSKNIWLRQREGLFEIKLPMDTRTDRFEEVEDEQRIKNYFQIDSKDNLKEQLINKGYHSFCTCKTMRRKYKKEGFNIDIDEVEFDDGFMWQGMEIELMINDRLKADEASKRILEFSSKFGLQQVNEGKVSEYLKYKKPAHFRFLVDSGIFQ